MHLLIVSDMPRSGLPCGEEWEIGLAPVLTAFRVYRECQD
jgi:hypothetical protein